MQKLLLPLCVATMLVLAQTALAQKKTKKSPQQSPPAETLFKLNSYIDTVSYIIGSDIGYTLKRNGLDLKRDALIQGLGDALQGTDTLFSIEQAETIVRAFTEKFNARTSENVPGGNTTSTADGASFLAENRKNPAVKETASGLQYIVVEEGTGEHPKPTDQVTVHYRGRLLDGTQFDSSYDRGSPATFELGRLITGWVEGIQFMKPGAKFMFFVPPHLGYGDRNIGEIPPNSLLIFEVELISF